MVPRHPHYIVLIILDIGVVLAAIGAWLVFLFTGRYPRGLFDFMVGAMRWHNRVIGYERPAPVVPRRVAPSLSSPTPTRLAA